MDELTLLQQALKAGGAWHAVAMASVVAGVRVYRLAPVQALLPAVAQWARLKPWARLAIVGLASMLSAWAAGLLAGQPVWVACVAAATTAIGALGGHKGTKAIGTHLTERAVLSNPSYSPSGVRRVAELVVPVDRKVIQRAGSIRTRVERQDD